MYGYANQRSVVMFVRWGKMKCPECGGTGKVHKYFYEKTDVGKWEMVCGEVACEECDGTGEVEVTNEEWLCNLSTEEKARFLERICYSAWGDRNSRFKDMADYTDWIEWLKEIYREG